jgi:hypothetical protein
MILTQFVIRKMDSCELHPMAMAKALLVINKKMGAVEDWNRKRSGRFADDIFPEGHLHTIVGRNYQ